MTVIMRTPTPQLSAGAKKELLVLLFSNAMLKTALNPNVDGAIDRPRENKYHKLNAQIDRRIIALSSHIEKMMEEVITPEMAFWLKRKNESTVIKVLDSIKDDEIQLEMLGLYVMFVNFCERDKKIDPIFQSFTNCDLYFDEIDLLKKTDLTEDVEAEMMKLAYVIIGELKG